MQMWEGNVPLFDELCCVSHLK